MHTKNTQLEAHLRDEHGRSRFAEYLREIVYGGIDGIVTTFAVVAGFTGAALSGNAITGLSFLTVLLFGLANLFADGLSMGLGNFLSVRSDQDVYRVAKKKELHEIKHNAPMERAESIAILEEKGFSKKDAEILVSIYEKNETYWVDFMMKYELEMSDPEGENPWLTGLATFCSFIFFGFIPLIPFFIFASGDPQQTFVWSAVGAGVALLLLGILKWRVVGTGALRSILEVVLVGSVAGAVAFLVGSLFRGL